MGHARAADGAPEPFSLARAPSSQMPIYEYACRSCGKVFEAFLIRRTDEAEVACPVCATREVEKVISRPAAVSAGSGAMAPRGGGCAPGG